MKKREGLTPVLTAETNKWKDPYRPTSKAGEARGERSVVIVKMPSNFRSGYGAVTEAETRVRTLFISSAR